MTGEMTGKMSGELDKQDLWLKALEAFKAHKNEEARAYAQAMLVANPKDAQALELLGVIVAERDDRVDEGVALIEQAIALAPQYVMIYVRLIQLLQFKNRHEQARSVFERTSDFLAATLAQSPQDAVAAVYYAIISCYFDDVEQVRQRSQQALSIAPHDVDLWRALATFYQRVGLLSQAEEALWHLVTIEPTYESKKMLAALFKSQNKVYPAIAMYQWAQQQNPSLTWLPFWEGELFLLQGHYAKGWPLYCKHYGRFNERYVNGAVVEAPFILNLNDDLNGKVLHIFCDQGIGDSIMYLRYLPLLQARGAILQLGIRGTLVRLTQSMGVVSEFFLEDAYEEGLAQAQTQLVPPDYIVSLSTLAYSFATEVTTIPYSGKYLEGLPHRRAFWRERLACYSGKKIGLIWAGNPRQEFDSRRTLSFERFAQILDMPPELQSRVHFFSLQMFCKPADRVALASSCVTDWMHEIEDYADTASLMQELDLVISVCTSGVHAAGALGVPVWVLLSYATDWRWHLDQGEWAEKSPWYQSARLMRQKSLNGWDGLLAQTRQSLIEFVRGAPST